MSICNCSIHGKQLIIKVSSLISRSINKGEKPINSDLCCFSYEYFIPSLVYDNYWFFKEEMRNLLLPFNGAIFFDESLRRLVYEDIDDESDDALNPFPLIKDNSVSVCFKCFKDVFEKEYYEGLNALEERVEIKM
jgi:hypothetical protein